MKTIDQRLTELKKRYPNKILLKENERMIKMVAALEENQNVLSIIFRRKLLAVVVYQQTNDTCLLQKYSIATPFKESEFRNVLEYMFYLCLLGYQRYVVDQNFEGPLPAQVKKGSPIQLSTLFPASARFLHPRNKYMISAEPYSRNDWNAKDKVFLIAGIDNRKFASRLMEKIVFDIADKKTLDRLNEIYERNLSQKDLIFRRARQADCFEIDELHRNGMNQFGVGIPVKLRASVYPDLYDLKGHYHKKDGVFIVAEYRGKIIGTGACKKIGPASAELTRFSVAKPYQGLGLGSVMLSQVLHLAAEEGYSIFYLRTSERQMAANFYKRKERFLEEGERIESEELNRLFKLCGLLLPDETGVKLIDMEKTTKHLDVLRYLVDHDLLAQHPRVFSFQFDVDRIPWNSLPLFKPSKGAIKTFKEFRAETKALLDRLFGSGSGSLETAYEQEKRQRWRQIKENSRRESRKRGSVWAERRGLLNPTEEQLRELKLFTILSSRNPDQIDRYREVLLNRKRKKRETRSPKAAPSVDSSHVIRKAAKRRLERQP